MAGGAGDVVVLSSGFSVLSWCGCGDWVYEKQNNKPLKIDDLRGLFYFVEEGVDDFLS
jgi:hypothetical protein